MEPLRPDHIILGSRDLGEGIAYAEELSGYRAAPGGSHPGRGTRNALLRLGERCYLEILAPDPEQSELGWHKQITGLKEPLLIGWAVETKNLEAYAACLRAKGIHCTGPTPGSRTTPGGRVLGWRTVILRDDKDGILPFHIDWEEDSPHPAAGAPGRCLLRSITPTGRVSERPLPGPDFNPFFNLFFNPLTLQDEPTQLVATIAGKHGEFKLKSLSLHPSAWSERQRDTM